MSADGEEEEEEGEDGDADGELLGRCVGLNALSHFCCFFNHLTSYLLTFCT